MASTVLITGSSSGIGKAAVIEFANKGWNVAATMRSPEKEQGFTSYKNVKLYALDVTQPQSITKAFDAVVKDFGHLDVLVNNAGYGAGGVFEAMNDEVIENQFNTNVFGLMRMTREAIRLMRPNGGGKIIQVSSMGGRVTFPLYSLYHSTKFAVEGFTESLHYELGPFNIQLKLVEPGAIKTEFIGRSRVYIKPDFTNVYDDYLDKFEKAAQDAYKNAAGPATVAATIYKAANDNSNRMRYPVGKPAPMLLWMRKRMPDTWFFKMVKSAYKM
jgi:NAD(P)-dependent dehydrogenase (short-subunit alcohol dehydrogenase family)